jgi:hypothetical protein
VSFAHIVKSAEPVFSVILSWPLLGIVYPWWAHTPPGTVARRGGLPRPGRSGARAVRAGGIDRSRSRR